MKIYLAALENQWRDVCPVLPKLTEKIYVLGSYFYIRNVADYLSVFPYCKDFLLDSGAFSFMAGSKTTPNWDEYIESYADFINKNNIHKFFELDIDSLVGYQRVKKLRYLLERKTNRACVPVWHISRGKEEFLRMCDEYSYVSVGGIVVREIPADKYGIFTVLIKGAHKRGARIHGLGFTNPKLLQKYHFDSVDSSSWGSGTRFGLVYTFANRNITQIRFTKKERAMGMRTRTQGLNAHNFLEWVKFQKYAETHL